MDRIFEGRVVVLAAVLAGTEVGAGFAPPRNLVSAARASGLLAFQ